MPAKSTVIASLTYNKKKIEVKASGTGQQVYVDGKQIPAEKDADSGAYRSALLPYFECGSLEELAKAVLDNDAGTLANN